MKTTYTLLASAVLIALQGCAATPDETASLESDLSKSLPPAAAGIAAEPLYYSSADAAAKALLGYNYGLVNLPDGGVQAFVSGLAGSGTDNVAPPNQRMTQVTSNTILAELSQEEKEMPFPRISLKEKVNGQAAIDALGDNLDEVARSYDMSPERLEEILRTDSTAWIDQSGRLLYIDSHTEIPTDAVQEATTAVNGTGNTATTAATADPFALHSKPGSNRLIYLDFNGHSATNTAWYSGTLTAQAYDIDGNPGVFSETELNNIREIWRRVAEDYAPFDVDVTTQEPPLTALQRTNSSDIQYGTRAVITRSMPQLCSQSCGGVAYVNVFSFYSSSTPDRYQPAWAFFDKLGNGNPKYVAEAVSHEVGHNLNLNHDGNATTGYYSGHGSDATGWAPIMGVGYYKPVTQWSKGEYSGANNKQDDVAVIHAAGAAIRADDYSNTITSAAPLAGSAGAVAQSGIIERDTDVDTFSFLTGGGNVQFTVTPDSVAANLDVLLKILDVSGNLVTQINPVDGLNATLSTTLAAGQFFLQVEGVGKGDLVTGYSDYGSLGQYQITGSYAEGVATLSPPTAGLSVTPLTGDAPLNVTLNGSSSSDSDGSITAYNWNFGDGTSASGSATTSHLYQTAGNYTATLTVTDNSGLTGSASQSIQVAQAPIKGMKSSGTKVTRKISGSNSQCVATTTIKYGEAIMPGATVKGFWLGSSTSGNKTVRYLATANAVTAKNGTVTFNSRNAPKNSKGTCAFTIMSVSKKGYTYDGSGSVSSSFSW
ncbi:PKD domain-containing protein [Methylomonas sp. LL1]|uniref:PKD domain-containing protein n=1 Tax=Methylomonas sp. LL1 TaxID=2785785 RepID=UPI0018C3671B|nr:PKD domain-containing protein [Methylomonas sp. LL1]QPK65246.1 PKD domain-containing protein [Methylomonas sp. LL1]